MYRRILVPLDGSPLAERAIPVAERLARSSGAALLLVRVETPDYGAYYWPYVDSNPAMMPLDEEGAITVAEIQHKQAHAYLASVADRLMVAGIGVETRVISGVAGESLLRTIEGDHPDLVVISSHGRTGLSRWMLGSVAHHLVRQSPAPVLVLRASAETEIDLTQLTHPVRMLVTLDGSRLAESVLGPAADLCVGLAGTAPAELRLLLVVFQFAAPPDATNQALLVEGARSYLERVAERLGSARQGRLRVTHSVVTGNDIAATIADAAAHGLPGGTHAGTGVDLVAMATHGATGLTRWVLGSITERVVETIHLPMLVVRPGEIVAAAHADPADRAATDDEQTV
jgi:nucleotide-binding universal stress UspA family protein